MRIKYLAILVTSIFYLLFNSNPESFGFSGNGVIFLKYAYLIIKTEMNVKFMRRGIVLSSDDVPYQMLLESIGMIEDAGYELVVFPERWGRDAFTIIAQAMHVTSKLKFATGIKR